MARPTILILAAGSSSRMRGADKLMEVVGGRPLVARAALAALATGCPVVVTLPPDRPARAASLEGLALTRVTVADTAEGLAASLRSGLRGVSGPVLVLLADLPEIGTEDLATLIARHEAVPERILRATAEDGTPGHPVLFPGWVLPDLRALQGDSGAREVLARHRDRVEAVPLPGRRAVTDLDTPEDWAAWRAAQAASSTRAS